MKKFWKSLMFAVVGAFVLNSCDDVPAPYPMPISEGDDPAVIVDPAGDGTLDTPYNVAAVRQLCGELEQTTDNTDKKLSPEIYVKGIVSKVETDGKNAWSSQYGNITYYISDDGKNVNEFEVYRGFGLDGAKFTSQNGVNVGDEVIICGKVLNFKGTYEFDQGSKLVSLNGQSSGGDTPVSGIEVTCAQAVELTNALADGATSEETYTITGYITEVVGSVSRDQQTFWMADTKDGGKVFEAYWANLPSGVTEFVKGSKVKITGNLMKYVKDGNVTPEIKNATVEILEAGEGGGGGDTPPVSGIEVTCAQAVELTNALADGGTSEDTYSVTGYITEIVGAVSRNQQTFWMADAKDGGKVFEAYYANLPSGVSAFVVGSKVKITGKLMKYVKDGNVTPEIKNATVEILEPGEGGGDNPGGGGSGIVGNSIDFSAMGYANAQDFDNQPITVGDATLTFSKASGGTTPKYYNTGTAMRMYGSNTLTISSSKTISKVEFSFADGEDTSNRPYYPTSSNSSCTPGTYDFSTHTWSGSANEIVLTYTSQGGHLRLLGLTITYAE